MSVDAVPATPGRPVDWRKLPRQSRKVPRTIRTNFMVNETEKARLAAASDVLGLSEAAIIRRAVDDYLDRVGVEIPPGRPVQLKIAA